MEDIVDDFSRMTRRRWVRSFAAVPGALLSLLPSATCPACIAGYAGLLSSLGLGFLLNERVLLPLIVAMLGFGVASIAWSTRSHRHAGPLVVTIAGSVGIVVARFVWNFPAIVYASVALLVIASVWNLWLKRPRPQPLVQLGRSVD